MQKLIYETIFSSINITSSHKNKSYTCLYNGGKIEILIQHSERLRHIVLRDLNILHFNMTPFLFEPGEEMSIEEVTVENVTAYADYPEQSGEGSFHLICLRPVVNQMHSKVPGKINNVHFKNISLTGEKREGLYTLWIKGADAEHMVSDVTFENITWFKQLLNENSPQVKIEENTKNIRFINPQNK